MPTIPRLYLPTILTPGDEVAVSPGQAHYLASVMRRGPGDRVRLFNGTDGEVEGAITGLRRDRCSIRIEARIIAARAEPGPRLVFAPIRREAMEWMVEKATELGACRLSPVITARTTQRHVNLDRLGAIAIEAAEQCERLTVPAIDPPVGLDALLDRWADGSRLIAAVERSASPMAGVARDALLIGPEGGLAPDELDALLAKPFVVPASFGPRVLRAETAAIVGLALLQARGPEI